MSHRGDAIERRAKFIEVLERKKIEACFFLATTFRSGSTSLGRLLFDQTRLAFHLEQFNIVPTWFKLTDASLGHAISQSLSPVVKGHYASKLMWPHRNNVATFLGIDRAHSSEFLTVFPSVKFVHLVRQDKVAQAVSYYIARKTDNWGGADERGALNGDVAYSFHAILEYYKSLSYHDSLWDDFFRTIDVEVKKVFFEDAIADPERATSSVLEAFALPPVGPGRFRAAAAPRKQAALNEEFSKRFLDDLYTLSPLELLPGRLIGPFTP